LVFQEINLILLYSKEQLLCYNRAVVLGATTEYRNWSNCLNTSTLMSSISTILFRPDLNLPCSNIDEKIKLDAEMKFPRVMMNLK
jgi:hypothetical protein